MTKRATQEQIDWWVNEEMGIMPGTLTADQFINALITRSKYQEDAIEGLKAFVTCREYEIKQLRELIEGSLKCHVRVCFCEQCNQIRAMIDEDYRKDDD